MGRFALGQSVPRTEDNRLTTGRGKYLDDFELPRVCHAVFLRSPHAHANIVSIDVKDALAMPGVIAVYTGADLAQERFGTMPAVIPRFRRDGTKAENSPRQLLVRDRVRVVGDAVAMVIAESRNLARDAAERIEVEYESLEPLVDTPTIRGAHSTPVWDHHPDNEVFFFAQGDKAKVEAIFACAHHVTNVRLVFNRVAHATLEPRGAIGDYDWREDRYTLYFGNQRPHAARKNLATVVLGIPETKLRVVSGDVGGSFGMKNEWFPEYPLCLWASKRVGRPVKWASDRSEAMQTDDQDRDHVSEASIALDKDGKFLAVKASNISNIGAYLMPAGTISASTHFGSIAGTYTTPAIYAEVSGVFSNTAANGAYRGSGRPEAAYIIERLIDNAAREMGIDRADIRRRNTIPSSAMPYKTGLVFVYDCGDFKGNLERALEIADYAGFETRRAAARKEGKLRGIGIANVVEQTAHILGETVHIRFDPSGYVTVITGSISHGQGLETMYTILVSDKLGIDAELIRVAPSDTDMLPDGGGTYASRSAVLGGSAALRSADKVIEKGKLFAAHLLEAAATDIEFGDGRFRVAGTDRSVDWAQVSALAYSPHSLPPGLESGLAETASYIPEVANYPNGCHICEVEIDAETGTSQVVRYSVVDDVGTVINALTLEGQIHGGIVQGIGQAFTEHVLYDHESGQLLTGSFMDYGLPRADNVCHMEMENHPVPTKTNPVGAKGAGEAGNVGALPAIMNAVVDALAPLGVKHLDMPATPQRVWDAIRASGQKVN